MLDHCRRFLPLTWALTALSCSSSAGQGPAADGCIAQATGTYDSVVLVQRTDGTLWVAANTQQFSRIDDPSGPLHATDSAASGSSAYSSAIGCAIVASHVWCFPLAGPLVDSTDLGAGLGFVSSNSPRQVATAVGDSASLLSGATQLAGGMNGGGASFCAVTSDGKVWCWGYDSNGSLGNGDNQSSSYARPVLQDANNELQDVTEVRVGFSSTCARKHDGSVWCWGDNSDGELGSLPASANEASPLPVAVSLPAPTLRLSASPGNTQCAILEDTSVVCWGRNEYAQAGAPSDLQVVPPTLLRRADGSAFQGARDLAPDRGMRAMCANTVKAGLWCWGDVLVGDDAGSPFPILSVAERISTPLSAYGARDGRLVYADPLGRLVLGAGSPPSVRQPPCP